MRDFLAKLGLSIVKTQEQSLDLLDKLIATARPNAVFGQPVTGGDYTVISASEVTCGLGLGFGGGGGTSDNEPSDDEIALEGGASEEPKSQHDLTLDETASRPPMNGYGTGGGGGGYSTARPVAAISIGPDGVHVEPVVDVTKIGLAFFTTLGAMALMFSKMQKASQR
jgi:uncharacterized spore protein YtfJ